jgi:DNA-binding NarL/FixJ family response regulator
MTPEALTVLIVDDHPVFREGLRTLLSTASDIEVVGEASTGLEAVSAADDLQPDVILMDLQLPELNGIESTRRIVQASPHIAVLVLTMFDDDDSVFAAMRAGARGYLLKGAGRDQVILAARSVARGEAIFGPEVAQRVIAYFAADRGVAGLTPFPQLSPRELDVLDLMAAGLNNAEIARRLFLSPKTVRNHISNVFAKLHVADRAQAIVRARTAGLGVVRP